MNVRVSGKQIEIGTALPEKVRAELETAGLEPKQAKLRAKQLWHQLYNRGATSFETMSDIARPQRATRASPAPPRSSASLRGR